MEIVDLARCFGQMLPSDARRRPPFLLETLHTTIRRFDPLGGGGGEETKQCESTSVSNPSQWDHLVAFKIWEEELNVNEKNGPQPVLVG